MPADGMEQRAGRKDDKPALKQVDQRRSHGKAADSETLEDDPGDRQCPLNAEQRPAHWSTQRDQRKGSVRARDKQVDCRVIEHLENMPRPGAHQRVIERGAKVDKYQRRGEDGAADDQPGSSMRGCSNKIDRPGNGKNRSDSVRDCVGKNVAEFGFGLHRLMIVRSHAMMSQPI